ncbi:hypothetical protein J4450_03455 [Candidatus Micrarchaeota archaeon]|nr:hypothetical protein [Candidatus Micrarchaeota archaeon]
MRRQAIGSGQCAVSQRPIAKSQVPLTDKIDKSTEFKRWLALFFIERGRYKITGKGYTELAPQVIRQNLEFGEPVSDRKREPRLESTRPLTPKEIKETVAARVEGMIREGKTEELLDEGHLAYKSNWKNKQTRITVIKKLLEFLGASPARLDKLREELGELILKSAREEPTDTKRMQEVLEEIKSNLERIRKLSFNNFRFYGISGMTGKYHRNSPYLVLVEIGYAYSEEEIREHARTGKFGTDKIYPWEMQKVGSEVYKNNSIRVAAIKWVVWKLKKKPSDINTIDFQSNLGGLLRYYNDSVYSALVDAEYAHTTEEILTQSKIGIFNDNKAYPWELERMPFGLWPNKEIRIAATKWLVWKTKKDPREITHKDFNNNRLNGLLNHCEEYAYRALVEAGYVYSEDKIKEHAGTGEFKTEKIYPWEMDPAPHGFYEEKENRIAVIKWLFWKTRKQAKDIIQQDFINNGIATILKYYNGSPYEALLEADLIRPENESYMRKRGYLNLQKRHS